MLPAPSTDNVMLSLQPAIETPKEAFYVLILPTVFAKGSAQYHICSLIRNRFPILSQIADACPIPRLSFRADIDPLATDQELCVQAVEFEKRRKTAKPQELSFPPPPKAPNANQKRHYVAIFYLNVRILSFKLSTMPSIYKVDMKTMKYGRALASNLHEVFTMYSDSEVYRTFAQQGWTAGKEMIEDSCFIIFDTEKEDPTVEPRMLGLSDWRSPEKKSSKLGYVLVRCDFAP